LFLEGQENTGGLSIRELARVEAYLSLARVIWVLQTSLLFLRP